MSFRLKIILGINAIQALLLWMLIANSLDFLHSTKEVELQKYAQSAGRLLVSATKNSVLATDLASLEASVAEAISNPDIDYARVLDAHGVLLAQAGTAQSLARPFRADVQLKEVKNNIYNASAAIDVLGINYGRAELGVSINAINAALQEARSQRIGIALIALILVTVCSYLWATFLCHRLNILSAGSLRLSAGELGHQIRVYGKDELAKTALAFNNMSRELHVTELARQSIEAQLADYRDHLEQLVSQRTDELGNANEGLRQTNRQLEQAHDQLNHAAYYDSLTKLPNRKLMLERLKQYTAIARRNSQRVTVVFIDLDRFKFINDSLGHKAGDVLLQIIAERLSYCIRESDTAARLGGDEFVLLLIDQSDENETLLVLKRVLEEISTPANLLEHQIQTTCSIGCSIFPDDSEDIDTLLKLADTAMYRAKENGKNNYQFFMPEMQLRINQRLSLELELRSAIHKAELLLLYQPQINARNGEICGVEALIRWQHPSRGLLDPLDFIPLAEDIGLIKEIGEWVIGEACRQSVQWQNLGFEPILMAVNLSIKQFLQDNIATDIAKIIHACGMKPDLLELELTESLSTAEPERCLQVMKNLKDIGVKLAIDDFGTGYSNLSYLKQFPIDKLKIDRVFVKDITQSPEDLAISTSIIVMAHSLGVRVIAEGVETRSQLELLASRGCDEIQGFYFAEPMPALELAKLFTKGSISNIHQPVSRDRKPAILFVDDEAHVLSALKRSVGRTYQVLTCRSAKEALEILATEKIAVLVSDQNMPMQSGTELLNVVKRMHPKVTRILLTGELHLPVLQDAVNTGEIFRFLSKPWDDELLKEVLAAAFEKYEMLSSANRNPWESTAMLWA